MAEPVFHLFLKRALLASPLVAIVLIPMLYFTNKSLDKKVEAITSVSVSSTNASEVATSIAELLLSHCLDRVRSKNIDDCYRFTTDNSSFSESQIQRLSDHYAIANRFIQKEKDKEEERQRVAKAIAIADGSYQPSRSDIEAPCKKMVEERSLTGDVNWGWFNADWLPEQKTLILKGKTSNTFGTMIPFAAECKWEKGGIIRLLEISR